MAFKNLNVWQKAIIFVKEIYNVTSTFPDSERYGLINQLRRAAVSIPSNIAEGHDRNTNKEYVQYLYIARGSCAEVDTQVIISRELGYISEDECVRLISDISEIGKMITGLIKARSS